MVFQAKMVDCYFYFETKTTETSASIRWEAFKAFIRGQIIQITSVKARKPYQETKMPETEIKALERNDYYQSRSAETHQRLLLLRTKYNEISASKQ